MPTEPVASNTPTDPSQTQRALDIELTDGWSVLLQGKPKSGKTTLALQFPKPWIADADNNMSGTIRYMLRNKMHDVLADIKIFTPDRLKNDAGLWEERPYGQRLLALNAELKAMMKTDRQTFIIDGITKLNTYIIGDIGRQKPRINEKDSGLRNRREGEMSLADWNDHQFIWQNFITKLQATGRTVIFTAHEEQSDREDLPGTLISVQGKKVQATLAGMFTDVWRCEVNTKPLSSGGKEQTFTVRTQGDNIYSLGCSLGLPPVFTGGWKEIKAALDQGYKLIEEARKK